MRAAVGDPPIAGGIDAVGPAVYYGPQDMTEAADTPEGVLAQLDAALPEALAWVQEHSDMIRNNSNGTIRVLACVILRCNAVVL